MARLTRAIDLRGALSINVITMIGIGPLVTIPLVIAALGGPLALVGWIGGAIVALCDGLVWAELSSHYPGSGGTYVYLRNVFGPAGLGRALAFLFNWQFLLAAPCLLASGYIGFANYAAYVDPALGTNVVAHDAVAAGIGVVTIALLYRRTSQVAAFGTILAIAATVTIALVAFAGLSHANFAQAFHLARPVRFGAGFLAGFGSALYITLYDYAGYSEAALLGDEVVRPRRTIPAAILLSVLVVAVLYVLLQIGVLGSVPWQSLLDAHGAPTAQAQYVGALVVERTWGRVAALSVTALVLVTAFASLYGNLLGFSRISYAAARDGAFLAIFARLHPRKDIPHVALLAVGGLSLLASLFTLDQVIAFLTAGIVLIQGVVQIVALVVLRARRTPAPFRMRLYPLPALVALAGWAWAFVATGPIAIALGVGWLICGAAVYLIAARLERWWPFLLAPLLLFATPAAARADNSANGWPSWHAARVMSDHGYPVFAVDGRPFFVYGAAFFYERIPHNRWRSALLAYKDLGINTLDLYVMWNWHQPSDGAPDFTGATDPRRDLAGLLKMTHELGFKLIVRPGPVIRNEWRNGGYPAWLLKRAPYDMPPHDILEGRYPATATLQNAHADAAGAQWLGNATHRQYASTWLHDALGAIAPYAGDVIAIALDDDQGAYLDNDTWPAPHWRAYIGWLRSTVQSVVGPRVPLFINTYEMKVPAASPVWAWGNWYQTGSYRMDAHDFADLDFATGLLQTQPDFPLMQAEFQAGWFQGADEGAPRLSDPSNTVLALHELLRDGAHGIVDFPVQDTVYPAGWEAPWANWSYAWGAALTSNMRASPRYIPTFQFGDLIRRYGPLLARTHIVADAAIVWPPSLFRAGALSNDDFSNFADATVAMQRACNTHGLSCVFVDLRYAGKRELDRYPAYLLPIVPSATLMSAMEPQARVQLADLRRSGRLFADVSSLRSRATPATTDTTLLLADDESYGFIDAVNPSDVVRSVGPFRVALGNRIVSVAAARVAPRSTLWIPIGVAAPAPKPVTIPVTDNAPPFADKTAAVLGNELLRVAFSSNAGARISELDGGTGNVATGIGLLRDAVDPEPTASARDYIAAYTHPIPAGTFNRPYDCNVTIAQLSAFTCAYDAPDLPPGGARFERRLIIENGELHVSLKFEPHDPASIARFESISGFAFAPGDAMVVSADGDAIGILHGTRLAWLRWRAADIGHVSTRQTHGAQIVTLVFAGRSVELRLGVDFATDPAEARRLLDAKQP